jgi:hypothetical protein
MGQKIRNEFYNAQCESQFALKKHVTETAPWKQADMWIYFPRTHVDLLQRWLACDCRV